MRIKSQSPTTRIASTVQKVRQTAKKTAKYAPSPPQTPSSAGNVYQVISQAQASTSTAAAQFQSFATNTGAAGSSDDSDDAQSQLDQIIASITSVMARDRLVHAVKHGLDLWRVQARMKGIKVMAVSAIGTPGCLHGPDLEPLILSYHEIAGLQGYEADIGEAVAEGVAHNFQQWADHVTVPGLPWYPAFAAWPGPEAPPMPNVPFPLIACVSGRVDRITSPSSLESAMYSRLPSELQRPETQSLMNAIALLIAAKFATWLAQQLVMNVMGKGPVPSFAPPYVPVGPVVNGSAMGSPGHLAV